MMKMRQLLLVLCVLITNVTFGQNFMQYFDGADTICDPTRWPSAVCVTINNDSTNIWQIGPPKKSNFDSAATFPNAIITDTANFYPANNTSSFQFTVPPRLNVGILAIQWKQKLDMDLGLDGGKIEFTKDKGATWQSVFNNPLVYKFYGYDPLNVDTLPNGDFAFSGTDTVWRDIWLCYDISSIRNDTLTLRFTFTSDSINNNKEGWLIDNILLHITIMHTVGEVKLEKYLNVYPNPTSDIIYIETQKIQSFHIIEQMQLINSIGQVVEEWKQIPTKFFINAKNHSNGLYYLKVKTNIHTEVIPVVINHQ